MEVSDLLAGLELDALVAEKVMGYSNPNPLTFNSARIIWDDVPLYSTDIADAVRIAEQEGIIFGKTKDDQYFAVVSGLDPGVEYWFTEESSCGAIADTICLAICKSALIAHGG